MTDKHQAPRHTNDSPLASARLEAGLTQAQLGQLVGVSASRIGDWEAGRYTPRYQKMRALSDALHRPIEELFPA